MRLVLVAICGLTLLNSGCKKALDKLENQASTSGNASPVQSNGPYSGGDNPTVMGATQGVRKAGNRTITLNELKNLHLFMYNAYSSSGQVPNSTVTFQTIYKEDQNLYNLVKDQLVFLVPNPTPEGVWAYTADTLTSGGFVVTQQGVERKTPAEFQAMQK